LVFAPDGRSVAATAGSRVKIWDTARGKEWGTERAGHRRRVSAVAYAPDGRWLVSGRRDGSVRLWDARTGRQLRGWPGQQKEVSSVAFSPDGRRVAATTGGKTLVFDAISGEERMRFDAATDGYQSTVYSPDGRLFAAPGEKGTVCLRRAEDGAIIHT